MQTKILKSIFKIDLKDHNTHILGLEMNGLSLIPEHEAFGVGYQDHVKGIKEIHPDAICRHYWNDSGR
jgi:hypothetical protein